MFSNNITSLTEKLSQELRNKDLVMATAESCTGGLIASAMTSLSGSSDIFDCGLVTYSNESKVRLLNVPVDILDTYGAVSQETAEKMVLGLIHNSNVDLGISVTGIAGPSGGSSEKPVGLVYVGTLEKGHNPLIKKYNFEGDRESIRLQTVQAALQQAMEVLND